MCRIVGILSKESPEQKQSVLVQARDVLAHGGPDAADLYVDENIALGHRRLSILDLSDAGKQPMYWNQYVIIYNGEIYNFEEIRAALKDLGYTFKTDTDTEVILKAYEKWGKDCVQHFRGMFAFAIWDKQAKKLLLCRDRVGVKPLYYYYKDGLFMFASELKAFHEHPRFDKTINHEAVSLYLQQSYIPSPHCIFKYAKKVKPGSFLEIDTSFTITEHIYWNVTDFYTNSTINTKPEGKIKEELKSQLLDSFQLRMVADVPVGMFLSGGVDSSLVTAMLQKASNTQLQTFTIGFENEGFNEANHAKKVAAHIGTNHTELYCTEDRFKELIPKLPDFYDEPFGDESAIPTYLVSVLAKDQVKVCLSADGGDELFGGYTKYEFTANYYPKTSKIPKPLRTLVGAGLSYLDANWLDKQKQYIPLLRNYTDLGSKIPKFKNALLSNNLNSFFNNASVFVSEAELARLIPVIQSRQFHHLHPRDKRLISYLGILDVVSYLEGDIMTKVDRATMQTALEGREPLLDHHLIEYAMQLPDNIKVKDGSLKYILRQILYDYVPKDLIERPKQGFSVPIFDWLHSFMKQDLLTMISDRLFIERFQFNEKYLRELISRFLARRSVNCSPNFIWLLLVLYKWDLRWLRN